VNAAALTITASNKTKTYGDTVVFDTTTPSTDFSVVGLVNADTVGSITLTSAGAAGTATVAGSPYAIIPSAAVGTGLDNYNISYVNGSLTVNAAALTITASNKTKTYGDTVVFDTTTPSTDFSVVGLVNADTVASITLASAGAAAAATVPGSAYAIIPSAAVGTGLANYNISYVNGALTVQPAILTVTAKSASRPFNTPNPDLSAPLSITGFVLGQGPAVLTMAPTCSTTATMSSPVGSYDVICSGGVAANYSFTYVKGTLSVTGWHLTGFYEPVGVPKTIFTPSASMLPVPTATTVWNTIKGGQAVPLKFEIFVSVGGAERMDLTDVASFTIAQFSCSSGAYEDPVDFTTPGNTELRYTGSEFHQNWKTPTGVNKCYRATMTASDGSHLSAFFKTK
jgi:hypothetical protein